MFKKNILILMILVALAGGVTAFPMNDTSRSGGAGESRFAGKDDNATPASEDLAIVVNNANATDDLSLGQLRSILLAERAHWSNGQKITVVMREQGHPERALILRAVCRMSETDFNQYLMHSTFTGQVQGGPKLLASAPGVRKFIFNVPGAIGYLRAAEVDRSVKAVRIEGRLPGDAGYKLKLEGR
jgi:ABC-type phosphate transport system substrate-binding protein